jgi:hypothetical protein
MPLLRFTILSLIAATCISPASAPATRPIQDAPQATQLPAEIRGAKVFKLPEKTQPGQPPENPVIYRDLAYDDISFERLMLKLSLSVRPVDRAATVRRIFFQDVQANGVPIHVATFDEPFKLSKSEVVDLPAPLECSIVFSELDSLKPVQEIVSQDTLLITGQSFIEIKLNALEKLALRAKQLVIPVPLHEEIPLHMFSDSPLLRLAASKIIDTLTDPTSTAAIALAKQHLEKLREERTLDSLARPALYFLYCEYALTDPKTKVEEKFSQSGTGFVASADGKLLTAKRVVEPWKFDPAVAFLMARYNLQLAPEGYKLYAWPVGTSVLSPDGELDFQAALRTDNGSLKLLKTAPGQPQEQEYQDPDSGERATIQVEPEGANDVAVLQLSGTNFQPLAFAAPGASPSADTQPVLYGFPFGSSQAQANPNLLPVKASIESGILMLDHALNPGESGAPLLTPDGKVLALAAGANQCVPIEAARALIQ